LALNPGRRLGPYEITAPFGVGGKGQVCSATDTNLKHQVAIKCCPHQWVRKRVVLVTPKATKEGGWEPTLHNWLEYAANERNGQRT
jgi:hypothetical protein